MKQVGTRSHRSLIAAGLMVITLVVGSIIHAGCSAAPESDGFEQLQGIWKMLNVIDTPATANDSISIQYVHYLQIGSDRTMRFAVTPSVFSDAGRMQYRNHAGAYYYFESVDPAIRQVSQPYRTNLIGRDTLALKTSGDLPDSAAVKLLVREQ